MLDVGGVRWFWSAHLILEIHKISCQQQKIAVKEEGYSPHFNQAYDKFAGKSNNAAKKESLSFLRGTALCINRAGFYQWGLLHAGLFAINGMKE